MENTYDDSTALTQKKKQRESFSEPLIWTCIAALVSGYAASSLARLNATGVLDDAEQNFVQGASDVNSYSISVAFRFTVLAVLIVISFLQAVILRFLVRLVLPTADLAISRSWLYMLISQIPFIVFSYLFLVPSFPPMVEGIPHIVTDSLFALIHTTIYLLFIRRFTDLRGALFAIVCVLVTGLNIVFVML